MARIAHPTPELKPEQLLEAAAKIAAEHLAGLAERPVRAELDVAAMLALPELAAPVADSESDPFTVLRELARVAAPGLTAMSGPRFFGWVTGGTLPAALAADWLTSAWDQNAGPVAGAPAAAAFELTSLRWVCELLELPEVAGGALVTGATMANFTALAAARHHVLAALGHDVERDGLFAAPRVVALVSSERHETIDKALRLLGLGKRCLRAVAADSQGRMNPEALGHELRATDAPVLLCTQAGNVNSGAFDPFTAIADEVRSHRERGGSPLWWHVDGAFGLWARAAGSTRALTEGVEQADSWATDAHKVLNAPYDCGIVLTRHPRSMRRANAVNAAYLSAGDASADATPGWVAPGLLTPELSRRARGFVLWAALRELGREGLETLVARLCTRARELGQIFDAAQGFRVLNQVVFNQVTVGVEAPEGIDPKRWIWELCGAIQRDGTCYATPTIWRGCPALRFSITNAGTTPEDIRRSGLAVLRVAHNLVLAQSEASR